MAVMNTYSLRDTCYYSKCQQKLQWFVRRSRARWLEVSPPQIILCHSVLFAHHKTVTWTHVIILSLNMCKIVRIIFSPHKQNTLQRSERWMMQNWCDLLQLNNETLRKKGEEQKPVRIMKHFSPFRYSDWDKTVLHTSYLRMTVCNSN